MAGCRGTSPQEVLEARGDTGSLPTACPTHAVTARRHFRWYRVTRRPPRGSDGSYGPCGPAWTERPGRPRRLTGRGAPPGFGARRTGTAVAGLRPVSARAYRSRQKPPHESSSSDLHTPFLRGSVFECRQGSVRSVALTGARTDPPETSSAEVLQFSVVRSVQFSVAIDRAAGGRPTRRPAREMRP